MINEEELRALARLWIYTAYLMVPAEYKERGLHSKYFKLDNEAAGLISCANDLTNFLDCAAELPLEPSAQHSEAGDAPTLSGLYNCQLCGLEKCSQPGICKDCLSEPSKAEVDQWSAAKPASS